MALMRIWPEMLSLLPSYPLTMGMACGLATVVALVAFAAAALVA